MSDVHIERIEPDYIPDESDYMFFYNQEFASLLKISARHGYKVFLMRCEDDKWERVPDTRFETRDFMEALMWVVKWKWYT